ncbi:hypothetical protein CR203_11410 [Salipaludibacillus neizhouensis]|uniref:Addiction module toxin, HicA family n=1 Tax=Salipaludibacillus neizhouensis TaxID=885475 RepID=A0A3A9KR13_9BACI|nr:type II toxin-antitoxin system HicA family toxin [Salipaludibacillus neizhouensis]RKL67116.1 hypothetical protein CR203_11410 [Salipaludibacillus neizhouensis]
MASWKDFRKFLLNDGWIFVRHGSRDDIYEKELPNGEILRTRVSKSSGEIGKGLFSQILKKDLGGITKEEFNKTLKKKKK